MTSLNPLFVRIRDPEGRYLGGEAAQMVFCEDVKRAIVFDCRRDHIDEQLEYLRLTKGLFLRAEPVDPKEIHETCDGCGRLALSFHIFFDGERYLCAECRHPDSKRVLPGSGYDSIPK